MSIPIYQIDAFAERPFSGNPACICLMQERKSDAWLQSVAGEMNLSETAFVWRRNGRFDLRWFTPVAEVKLCGHATLAAAHALWSSSWLAEGQAAVFDTLSGELRATRVADQVELDVPANRPVATQAPPELLKALGIETCAYVGTDHSDYLLLLESERAVRKLDPDFRRLKNVKSRGTIVTAQSDNPQFDFVSRFFAPAVGVDEDPVTGSAHTVLAPFWADRSGRNVMRGCQLSARAGVISTRVDGDRVILGGQCVTVLLGNLMV